MAKPQSNSSDKSDAKTPPAAQTPPATPPGGNTPPATPPVEQNSPGKKKPSTKTSDVEASPTTTHAALKKQGIEVLAEVERADGLISRVLQDAKRVWKELFHAA